MKKPFFKTQRGMVLIVALLMLLVLTLIGISSISTTTYEIGISGNERVWAEAFYASEAGVQVALHQLPQDLHPIPRTELKKDSYYWSGEAKDEEDPQSLRSLGLYQKAGFDTSWAFKRFQIRSTGKSSGAIKEIDVQVNYGPVVSGTQYNP